MKNRYATVLMGSALLLGSAAMAQSGMIKHNDAPIGHFANLADPSPAHHATASNTLRGGGAPVNDACSSATAVALATGASITFTGDNTNATAAGDFEAGSGLEDFAPVVWHRFSTTECANVTVSYCATSPAFANVAAFLANTCPATDADYVLISSGDFTTCPAGDNATLRFDNLPAGDYYFPVLMDTTTDGYAAGPYSIDVSAAACIAPPANDECSGAVNQNLSVNSSVTFTGDNSGATDNGEGLDVPAVWEMFTTTECANLQVTYCGTTPPFGNGFLSIYQGCPYTSNIEADSFDATTCADGNFTLFYPNVPAGTYYYAVMLDPSNSAVGPYTITVSATECIAPTSYCIPNPATGTADGDFIATVQLGDINYTGPNDVNYVDNTALSTDLAQSSQYTMSITGGTYAPDVYAAWIDYNNDFVFDQVTEKLGEVSTVSDAAEVVTITFTVPAGADLGPARLRVRGVYNATGDINACTNYTYGETEDYTVNIQLPAGVSELDLTDVSVFPNPSNGDLSISGASLRGKVDFQLMDMTGRTVYQDQRTVVAGQRIILPLNGKLAQGTYSLRMITDKGFISRPVMIK